MSRFFWIEDKAAAALHGGSFDAWHPWRLPGVRCLTCGATWSDVGHYYPSVDLSHLAERKEFVTARPEPFAAFARLRELVRPLAPPNAELPPGTGFGPVTGSAFGRFGPLAWVGELKLLVRWDALERLQAEGVRGLRAYPTALRFRRKDPPELLELQVEPRGWLHPDCIPPEVPHRARPVVGTRSAGPTSPSWTRPPCLPTGTCSGWATTARWSSAPSASWRRCADWNWTASPSANCPRAERRWRDGLTSV